MTSCATRSASIPSAPSETSTLRTWLFPLPMGPVRPMTKGFPPSRTVISADIYSSRSASEKACHLQQVMQQTNLQRLIAMYRHRKPDDAARLPVRCNGCR